ncbi:class I SAM-dependent methyltransferase [Streptomyces sp. ACA25]|uniref:class I SAM-dependent methyltransferase n=1 Tax=Streptomyces sp. ACA25 TaxID=3022596 RepID=UPI00230811A0|nr:class I SAM-dependent methyltransferase [Streptomyces sp. ACA25]MDB1087591.1 class I SAM-dependent methyltransferase [Streptomyces sp. ACA25]
MTSVSRDSSDTSRRQTWASGDYAKVGNSWILVSELLCESVGIVPGRRVLDVATGSGNAALAAARRMGVATGLDYVPELVEQARARAAADRLDVTFETGDAQQLPYPDASFDRVLSVFGVMFVPDQQRAADELARVLRPGGRIGLANWAPDGFMGQLFQLVRAYAPEPPASPHPALWGDPGHVRELLGGQVSALRTEERHWTFRFASAEAFVTYFRTNFGPLNRAFHLLDEDGQHALGTDLAKLIESANTVGDGTATVRSRYLEVLADK